jgi:uncharacterized protein (TIGR03437 family)
MKQAFCRPIAIAVLAAAHSVAGLADINQTTTLATNSALNLDTGETVASGGDILWNGSSITPQGKARAVNVGALGSLDAASKSVFDAFKAVASAAPIAASQLVVDDVFAVFTNGGNTAAVLVTANSAGSITLQFITYQTVIPAGANVTQILNNSSGIQPGLPNYGIAPSSLFIVKGTGLADPGGPVLQSSQPPGLPLTLNGASISVTVNGVTTHPAIYYTLPTQIAAVLPASTPIGTGTLTVTHNGVESNTASIKVVPSALGINTYNMNTAVATDAATGAVLTYTHSGTQGEKIVLWATGLGANPADSDTTFTSKPHRVNTPLQIYIGVVPATILYQGASPYPGVNQINLIIPQNAPNGCWISLAAVAGGVVSNIATLPINQGGGACFDTVSGLNGSQFSAGGGKTLRTGLVALIQSNTPTKSGDRKITTSTDAAFEKYTGIYAPPYSLTPGGCIINNLTPVPIGGITGLDPGTITLTGPSGSPVTLASQFGIKGAFYAILTAGSIPSTGGAYTFNGSGGADVGSFTATLTFSNSLLTWTNQDAATTIDRSQGLHVTWTGGNPGSYVVISGTSTDLTTHVTEGYTCLAVADDKEFSVPSYILSAIPAGKGGTLIQNNVYSKLNPTGIDIGVAMGDITFNVASVYQ